MRAVIIPAIVSIALLSCQDADMTGISGSKKDTAKKNASSKQAPAAAAAEAIEPDELKAAIAYEEVDPSYQIVFILGDEQQEPITIADFSAKTERDLYSFLHKNMFAKLSSRDWASLPLQDFWEKLRLDRDQVLTTLFMWNRDKVASEGAGNGEMSLLGDSYRYASSMDVLLAGSLGKPDYLYKDYFDIDNRPVSKCALQLYKGSPLGAIARAWKEKEEKEFLLLHPGLVSLINWQPPFLPGTFPCGLVMYLQRPSLNPKPDFDEAGYLAKYPDVADGVKKGAVPSGYVHYMLYGKAEGRTPSGAPSAPKAPSTLPANALVRWGPFSAQGATYFSNGVDFICSLQSPEHAKQCGISLNVVQDYAALPQMRNDNACGFCTQPGSQGELPWGLYTFNNGNGTIFSTGILGGRICSINSEKQARECGFDLSTAKNIDPSAIPSSMMQTGSCLFCGTP